MTTSHNCVALRGLVALAAIFLPQSAWSEFRPKPFSDDQFKKLFEDTQRDLFNQKGKTQEDYKVYDYTIEFCRLNPSLPQCLKLAPFINNNNPT
jgi:hypothetical protein